MESNCHEPVFLFFPIKMEAIDIVLAISNFAFSPLKA